MPSLPCHFTPEFITLLQWICVFLFFFPLITKESLSLLPLKQVLLPVSGFEGFLRLCRPRSLPMPWRAQQQEVTALKPGCWKSSGTIPYTA